MFTSAWLQSPSRLASTTASRHHAAASLIAPAPSDTVPMVVPVSFLNWMMRASIGKAVMHIEAPRNITAELSDVLARKEIGVLEKIPASPPPSRNGATIPATETATALRIRFRTMSTRNSSPTTNMYSASPSCDTGKSTFIESLGKQPRRHLRKEQPEQRRPQQHAGQHLRHHLRLAARARQQAHQLAEHQDHGDLEEKLNGQLKVRHEGRADRARGSRLWTGSACHENRIFTQTYAGSASRDGRTRPPAASTAQSCRWAPAGRARSAQVHFPMFERAAEAVEFLPEQVAEGERGEFRGVAGQEHADRLAPRSGRGSRSRSGAGRFRS